MYFYLIKAEQTNDWGKLIDDDIMLMYPKKLTSEQFNLLFEKIYTEFMNSDNTNQKIADQMERIGFQIVNVINPAYVVELKDGTKTLVYEGEEINYNTIQNLVAFASDFEKGDDRLFEDYNKPELEDNEEEYDKEYLDTLKKIVESEEYTKQVINELGLKYE